MNSTLISSDTIAAISTGMVTAGIGVIRISGDEAVPIADRVFRSAKLMNDRDDGKNAENQTQDTGFLAGCRTHTIHYGSVCDGDEKIDDVLVMLMRSPATYTGEDTVEISCHGGLYVLSRVLDTVIRAGARLAEPGEFTRRAFLNGKMDLTRAEAVAGLIEAENERARKAAIGQLSGREEAVVREYQEKILTIMAFAEAALDDPEHISVDESIGEIRENLSGMGASLRNLRDTSGYGRLITEGIRTAIVGKPNAGKSSFLNLLLGEDRSIVSDIAGTTRDTIREKVNLGTFTLTVIDTAGINRSDDPIEKIGVERAKNEIGRADLILYIMDGSVPFDENDREIAGELRGRRVIGIINKSDLPQSIIREQAMELLGEESPGSGNETETGRSGDGPIPLIRASAKTGAGVDKLAEQIEKMFFSQEAEMESGVILLNKRHEYALTDAIRSMDQVIEGIDAGMSEEFWLVDLKDVYDYLGEITGETVGENLIDEIFSKFCMGK